MTVLGDTMRGKMGRNPRSGEAAGKIVSLRLTAEEHRTYSACADAEDLALGEWIRAACVERLPRSKRKAVKP